MLGPLTQTKQIGGIILFIATAIVGWHTQLEWKRYWHYIQLY